MAIQRPIKTYGTRTYATEVAAAPSNEDPILATEVDADLDTIYTAFNGLVLTTTVSATAPATPQQGQLWWRNDPDGNLFISYNDGSSTQWVPAVPSSAPQWAVSGSSLTPVDATKTVKITSSADNNAFTFGGRTSKGRLISPGNADLVYFSLNAPLSAANAWGQDDATRPSWAVTLNGIGDNFAVQRQPAGSTTPATLLSLDSAGNLTLPGSGAVEAQVKLGTTTAKMHCFRAGGFTGGGVGFNVATVNNVWTRDDNSIGAGAFYYSDSSQGFEWDGYNAAGTLIGYMVFANAGNLTLSGPTGTKSTGTTWANPSDIRLKKNITPYTAGLPEILALQPVQFQHNGFADTEDGRQCWGYLADDVAAVLPECVSKHTKKLANDEEVELDMLDTSNISLAVVNAIKELAARVSALEGK